jgi:hypothetical protein
MVWILKSAASNSDYSLVFPLTSNKIWVFLEWMNEQAMFFGAPDPPGGLQGY